MGVDETLMRERLGRGTSSIRALLDARETETLPEQEPEAALIPLEELSPLPRPGDPYTAHARASNKPLPTLRLLLKGGVREGFAYSDLRRITLRPADQPGGGMVIVLRFLEVETTEVTIRGRNLGWLDDLIGQHRIAWIRELPPERDFQEERATVITSIAIKQQIEG